MKKQLSTYPLRLPTSLKTAVAEISRVDGTSIDELAATAVAQRVSVLRTAAFFGDRAARADVAAARRLLRRQGGQPPAPEDLHEQGEPRPLARSRSAAARCRCVRPCRRRLW